jgi:hypothetical protein
MTDDNAFAQALALRPDVETRTDTEPGQDVEIEPMIGPEEVPPRKRFSFHVLTITQVRIWLAEAFPVPSVSGVNIMPSEQALESLRRLSAALLSAVIKEAGEMGGPTAPPGAPVADSLPWIRYFQALGTFFVEAKWHRDETTHNQGRRAQLFFDFVAAQGRQDAKHMTLVLRELELLGQRNLLLVPESLFVGVNDPAFTMSSTKQKEDDNAETIHPA